VFLYCDEINYFVLLENWIFFPKVGITPKLEASWNNANFKHAMKQFSIVVVWKHQARTTFTNVNKESGLKPMNPGPVLKRANSLVRIIEFCNISANPTWKFVCTSRSCRKTQGKAYLAHEPSAHDPPSLVHAKVSSRSHVPDHDVATEILGFERKLCCKHKKKMRRFRCQRSRGIVT